MDEETVAIYEANAARWASRRGEAGDDLAASFRDRVGGGCILDAGCGVGRYLAQLGPGAVGLDAAPGMLRLASGPMRAAGDLEHLPFQDRRFTGVFARHSYLHLPKHRVVAALREALRVLRPGGLLLLSLIAGDYEGRRLPDDDFPGRWFALWSEDELVAALERAGYDRVTCEVQRRPWGRVDLVATAARPSTALA